MQLRGYVIGDLYRMQMRMRCIHVLHQVGMARIVHNYM